MSQSPPKWAAYPPRPPLCWEQADNPGQALPGTARPQSEASQEPRAPSQPASEVAGGTAQTSRRAACGGHPSAITYSRLLPPRPKPSPGLPTHSPARTPTLRTARPARVPGRATDSRSGPLVPGGTQPGARSTPHLPTERRSKPRGHSGLPHSHLQNGLTIRPDRSVSGHRGAALGALLVLGAGANHSPGHGGQCNRESSWGPRTAVPVTPSPGESAECHGPEPTGSCPPRPPKAPPYQERSRAWVSGQPFSTGPWLSTRLAVWPQLGPSPSLSIHFLIQKRRVSRAPPLLAGDRLTPRRGEA